MQDNVIQKKLSYKNGENNDRFFLAYASILINNPYFKAKIFEYFNYDIKRVFEADKNDLKCFSDKYPGVRIPKNFLFEISKVEVDKIYDEIKSRGVKYLTYDSDNFPSSLKAIEDFPTLLYYKGSLDNISFDRALALVGSRKATESAKQNVFRLIYGFLNTDVVIVSGLADGIDSCAHKAALLSGIKTIGVIGSGLDFIYPAHNKKLYHDIENGGGLVVSEYPCSYRPYPSNFPQRNRIITALSKGVIIAEARMRSGAMISARYALEQGRELMCIPGSISNPNCEGIYHLIKNGASIVTNTDDILNILNWEITPQIPVINIEEQYREIYDIISLEEVSIEGLQQKLDIGINELMVKLTEMELKGLITQKNGLYYV